MKRIVALTGCAFLLAQVGTLAHEGEKHGKAHKVDERMQKLHDIMPMYSMSRATLEAALEKGDLAAIEMEAMKMLATTSDLNKAIPHKNLKQLKLFRSISAGFESDIKELVVSAKKGDLARSRAAFRKANDKCTECHAKFR
jgi:cytochrome c556